MFLKSHIQLAILLTFTLSSIVSCSSEKTVNEYISAAQHHISINDNKTAVIELKNALKQAPNNAEARKLLGEIYLSLGDGQSAEKELAKAYSYGSEEAGMGLIKAYKIQQKNDEILELADSINARGSNNQAIIEVYRALAQYRLGNDAEAESAINNAIELSSDSMFSRLGSAYLASKKANSNDALLIVNNLLKDKPNFTEALLLQGQLYFSIQDYVQAVKVFERLQELQPQDLIIKLMLANAYIKNEQFDVAEKSIDVVLKEAPNHALSNQFKGVIKYQQEDYKAAYYHTEKAIQRGLNSPANKILLGISAFQLKNYEQSYYYLNSIKEMLSENNPILKLLAISQLKLGYSTEVNKTLLSLENLTPKDFSLFAAASSEFVKKGQIEDAKKLQKKLDQLSLSDPVDIARQGILQLSVQDVEGIAKIEKSLELEPNMPEAKIALAQAYINTKQLNKALQLANDWVEQFPKEISGYNLLAIVKLKMLDKEGGEAALNKALQINKANPLSLMYFAEQDIEANQPLLAIDKLESLLTSKPHYLPALSIYYVAATNADKKQLAIAKIKQSSDSLPDSIQHRLLFAKTLMVERLPKDVINLLSTVDKKEQLPAFFWIALGDSLIADNKVDEALKLYITWANQYKNSSIPWTKAAITAELNNDPKEALYLISKGLKYSPENKKLIVLQTYFYIENKQFDEAQSSINNMESALANIAFVQGLQGQIWANSKSYSKAIPKLMYGYQENPTSKNAGLIYFTYIAQHKKSTAENFLKAHVSERPNDYKMRNLLADTLAKQNKAEAYEHYLYLSKQKPNNYAVLNNLAWADYKNKNYKKAYDWGKKALALSPKNPYILDTVGMILLKLDEKEKAIEHLKLAASIKPNNREIAKHYKDALEDKSQ